MAGTYREIAIEEEVRGEIGLGERLDALIRVLRSIIAKPDNDLGIKKG